MSGFRSGGGSNTDIGSPQSDSSLRNSVSDSRLMQQQQQQQNAPLPPRKQVLKTTSFASHKTPPPIPKKTRAYSAGQVNTTVAVNESESDSIYDDVISSDAPPVPSRERTPTSRRPPLGAPE